MPLTTQCKLNYLKNLSNRLSRTINVMLYIIHLNTCFYYLYSDLEGIDGNAFVFNGYGNAYLRFANII
jgi:hypothetical protein